VAKVPLEDGACPPSQNPVPQRIHRSFFEAERVEQHNDLVTVEIPPTLRKARIADGESDWLDALPDLVAEIASLWNLEIGGSFDGFGMNALVVEATTSDGTGTVLKLAPPSEITKVDLEATVLRLADGAGCVRLLDADVDRRALLLERLGPSMYDLDVPRRQRHELLIDAVTKMWRPVAPGGSLQRGADRARWLIERLEQTCRSRRVTCRALPRRSA
jgi:streptomycin 6-kinase